MMKLLWESLMVGAAWGLGGAVLLLLLGSAILEWYWVVALFVIGASVSAWRTWRRIPHEYAIAQLIDERMGFYDAISTAYHFRNSRGHASEAVLAAQREEAERLAATADAAMAVPFVVPRQTYVALGVAAIAMSIFVVRYGVLGKLELKAPIVEAVADFFSPSSQVVARNKQKQPRLPGEEPMTLPVDQLTEQKVPLDQAPDSALDTVDIPETNQGEAKDSERTTKQQVKAAADQQGDEMAEGSEGERKGDEGKEGSDSKEGKESASDKSGKQPGEAQKPNQQGGGRENSSMMDKMRDAMANLMAKLKIPPQAGQQGKQGNNQKGNQQQGQKEQGGGQKGEKGEGQQQGKGTPSDDPNAEQGEGEQQAQAGQGKSSDKGSEQGSPNESKSGMGKQDGNKDLQDAAQLAAMGKISEIFGKRAQNMTGEVMVEVSSGKNQQLKTGYTERGATHKEAGGEIHRDEIPLVFQHYVQKYFEQVRQGEVAKPAAEGKK
ncbi:MAG: hypothetical protein JNN08_17140 [Bryobacterales bacterium]|nr:hypothetical protein [Bryobacterales bacterium]